MEDNCLVIGEYEKRIQDSRSARLPDFIEFQHSNGQFYFAYISEHKVCLRSEGYASAKSRDNGMDSVVKNIANKDNYRTESAHGVHFLILLASNNKEIARSYPMTEEVEAFILLNKLSTSLTDSTIIFEGTTVVEDDIISENQVENTLEEVTATVVPDTFDAKSVNNSLINEEIAPAITENETQVVLSDESQISIQHTPLLASFQKDIVSTNTDDEAINLDITTKDIPPQNKLDLSDFDDEISEMSEKKQVKHESTIEKEIIIEKERPVREVLQENVPKKEDIKNIDNKPQTKLGEILHEDEKPSKKSKWWLWLILIALLGGLLWWLYSMGGLDTILGKKDINDTTILPSTSESDKDSTAVDSASIQAKATWEQTLGGMVAIRLPDGSLINVPENGTEKKLVEYLEAKCGTSELKKTWFDMDRILFENGNDKLKPISEEQIILIAKIFKSYPKKKFKIGGYTDNVGDPEANIRLSAIRAAAATRAIAAKGIDSTRMRYEGYGQEHPLCPENNTEECRAKNRRVAIRVDVCE